LHPAFCLLSLISCVLPPASRHLPLFSCLLTFFSCLLPPASCFLRLPSSRVPSSK
jgi:hypothetical protein